MKTPTVISIAIIWCLIGLIFGWQRGYKSGYKKHKYEYIDSIDIHVNEELNYFFTDSSHQHLYGHRINLPEEFGDLGAYRSGERFPLMCWADDWGTIHIEMVPYGKIDSTKIESDIDKDEL